MFLEVDKKKKVRNVRLLFFLTLNEIYVVQKRIADILKKKILN